MVPLEAKERREKYTLHQPLRLTRERREKHTLYQPLRLTRETQEPLI